jgi:sec-independent protein translocase protein TatA
MGGLSIWHWLIVLAVVLLLFGGGGKVSTLMGDFAKGVKSFKKNMAEDESMEAQNHPDSAAHPAPTTLASPTVTSPGAASTPVQEPVRHS